MPSQTRESKYTPTPAGLRLREARLAAGFEKQTELAAAAGLGAQVVSRVETGQSELKPITAKKLAPVLRRSESWLLYGVESRAGSGREAKTPAVVEQYLTDEGWGNDCSPRVVKLLRGLDYSSIGLTKPTLKDVHRAREMIETNLALGSQRRA